MSEATIIQARLRDLTEQTRSLVWDGVTEVPIDVLTKTLELANLLADKAVTLEEIIRQQRAENRELVIDRAGERIKRRVFEALVEVRR